MTIKSLADALGVDQALASRWVNRGMPRDTVQAAEAWRRRNAPQRLGKSNRKANAKPSIGEADVKKLVPPVGQRHVVDGVDDQGERPGDTPSNPYSELRAAILAAKSTREQIRYHEGKATDDVTAYSNLQRLLMQQERHIAVMRREAASWAREQGVTLYVEEAKALVAKPLKTLLHNIELMAQRISPICQNPKSAKMAIEEFVAKTKSAVQAEMNQEKEEIENEEKLV